MCSGCPLPERGQDGRRLRPDDRATTLATRRAVLGVRSGVKPARWTVATLPGARPGLFAALRRTSISCRKRRGRFLDRSSEASFADARRGGEKPKSADTFGAA